MGKPKVLILDDEPTVHSAIQYTLRRYDVEFVVATKVYSAIEQFKKCPNDFVIAFVDHRLRQKDHSVELGVGIIPFLREIRHDFTPVMISGCEEESVLKSWLDQNVSRYLYKPLKPDHLKAIFEIEYDRWKQANAKVRKQKETVSEQLAQFGLVGQSLDLLKAVNIAMKAATSKSHIVAMILGESGTGKELVAKGIHKHSERADRAFLPINCASYAGENSLIDSELFGHEKGAFTGANTRKVGIFEAANGGTVFLDEIHCLSHKSQEKLLRFLQERKIRRVGGTEEYSIDVKLIAASKPNIQEMAKTREFLPDLFYRLNGFDINLPPLRKRRGDIEVLAHFFLLKKNEGGLKKRFSPDVLTTFKKHIWPGNVRELEMTIERAFEVSDTDVITFKDLPRQFSDSSHPSSIYGIVPLNELKEEYDRKVMRSILTALDYAGDNISSVSRILKTQRADIRYKIKSLGINELTNEQKENIINS